MKLILEQTFPLGRFHATPWKVFPYDDPHGEWPPSPWRLVRAALARSYQMDREFADSNDTHAKLRDELVRAFATSEVAWQLPLLSWRGPGLRQYHPAEFKRVPASAKEPGMMAYNTTKVLDNFWVTSNGTAAPVIWHFDGPDWTPPMLAHLDACLARMIYFGRAESITEIRRTEAANSPIEPVKLSPRRSGTAVPVLALLPNATLTQLEATTDAPTVKGSNIPPGSRWMYAERPLRPKIRSAKRHTPELAPANFIQFAIGCRVEPRYSEAVRLTERFRSRVLGRFAEHVSGFRLKRGWAEVSDDVKQKAALLSGKGVAGEALKGHRHTFFFLHGEPDKPTRLCLWRKEPFTADEQHAILSAASHPLPLSYKDDPWTITLVPLDRMVPVPAGFSTQPALNWKTLTPWVPPRHALDRKGRTKPGHGLEQQIREELAMWDAPAIQDINISKTGWVKSHQPSRSKDGRPNTNKLGYEVRLTFKVPFTGPLIIGHSAHFGLGLFVPAD